MKAVKATIYLRRSSHRWVAAGTIVFVLAAATFQLNLLQGYYYNQNRSLLDSTIFRHCNNEDAPPQKKYFWMWVPIAGTLCESFTIVGSNQQPHDSNNSQ